MSTHQAEIWSRLIAPATGSYDSGIARAILQLDFSESDQNRMEELSQKANAGHLTAAEEQELEDFISVGHVVALLQSKARLSLRNSSAA